MKQVIYAREITLDNQVLPIQGDDNKGCYVEILESLKSQMDAVLSYHCKVLLIRFELHLHDYSGDNRKISRFFRKLRKKLRALKSRTASETHLGLKRIGFIWVREMEKAKQQHYHCALMLDGNLIKQPSYVLKIIEDIWTDWGEPKPFTPKNCYYQMTRDGKNYLEAFKRCSYLAKTRGKGHKDKTANDYSSSRLKIKAGFYLQEQTNNRLNT